MDVFDRVWRMLVIGGYADDQGSTQYLRIRKKWVMAGRFQNETDVANFIKYEANNSPRNPLGGFGVN